VAGSGRLPIGDLPIAEAIDPMRAALAERGRVVLHAPPGAGKTTIVPLVLLEEPWCDGTVLVLEPRRLAVRNAARRLAQLLGEQPGERVGWRMRQDTKVSARTRIEVITEGVLTRRLQRDPELTGVSAVVFDEFHERSLDADLGLALTLEVVDALRPELRIVVMSATLDIDPVAALLDAPVIRSEGRAFPVAVVHVDPAPGTDRRRTAEAAVAPTVRRALAAHDGDVLVFLPGAAEIRRAERSLGDLGPGVHVRPLHGSMPPAAQDAAIAPSPAGSRKVVLSTAIAETSLTIEGVTVVVDAGLRRAPRLDPSSGMSRLVTLSVTTAEAEQRAGRAGRLAPGTAYRLWSRAEDAMHRAHPEPEIEVADLTPLALELAAWGASEGELAWLTPPPTAHLAAARDLLHRLGALDPDGTITPHGRAMAEQPMHPRLGTSCCVVPSSVTARSPQTSPPSCTSTASPGVAAPTWPSVCGRCATPATTIEARSSGPAATRGAGEPRCVPAGDPATPSARRRTTPSGWSWPWATPTASVELGRPGPTAPDGVSCCWPTGVVPSSTPPTRWPRRRGSWWPSWTAT
jgi:ATP-dependent helicase HrpB